MNIYIYEIEDITPTECVGILDTYSSLNFTKSFQGCGTWTLKGNFTKEVRRMLKVGRLIYVSPKVCGVIESIDFSTDDSGTTTYTAYGKELKGILGYRIVWDTYSRKVNARDWLNDIVSQNTGGTRRLFTKHEKPEIDTRTIDKQTSYGSLLDAVEAGCSAANTTSGLLLGFDITCDVHEGFTFSLLEGADRTMETSEPILISRDMNNVSTLNYVESAKETANISKCGGEGEGAERKFATAGDDSISGLARREVFVDARDLQSTYKDAAGEEQTMTEEQYAALLQEEANAAIKPDSISIDAETVVSTQQALELLGAKVSLVDRAYGVRTDDYVYEVNVIDEADGGLTTLTIGQGIEAKRIVL